MRITTLGSPLPPATARDCRARGIEIVGPDRAQVRLHVHARPPVRPPAAPWIWVATRPVDVEAASAAVLAGAYDVIALDDDLPARLECRLGELRADVEAPVAPVGFVAHSAAMKRVLAELERVARTSMSVLLTGETGTGKDIAARHIHERSGRKGQLVPINCAAVPNDLIEGELFGYVRGAFSGAVGTYDGLISAARAGTVFLDEVDDTPKTLQTKLLRVLEDHVVSRLGESEWHEVDFRIIAATNRDLGELVARGEFGADLYQRLAIVKLDLPPLRDRADDLPELARHLIARFYREERAAPHRVTKLCPSVLGILARYPWPGNVRELRNVLYHALVRKRAGDELLLSDLPEYVVRGRPPEPSRSPGASPIDRAAIERMVDDGRMNLRALRDELEKTALTVALAKAGGSPTRAARLLGEVGRGDSRDPSGTVRAMMRRHSLD
jgi:transcriptional regulator with GAF, ATPase, and Fis domain